MMWGDLIILVFAAVMIAVELSDKPSPPPHVYCNCDGCQRYYARKQIVTDVSP